MVSISRWCPALRPPLRLALIVTLVIAASAAPPCTAQTVTTLLFSTEKGITMQGNPVLEPELWEFDTTAAPGSEISGPLTQTGTSMFVAPEDIDGFSWQNDVYFLTVVDDATFTDNSLFADKNDIVRYDPNAPAGSRASIYYDVDTEVAGTQVDAISFYSDGDILLSFDADTTFAGLFVENGDVIKFDITDVNTRSIFFDESDYVAGADTNGFEFVSPTEMYLTTDKDAGLPGLPAFTEADIVLWDGSNASIVVTEAEFSASGGFNLDALSRIPEPSGVALFAVGVLICLSHRRRTAEAI